MTDNDTIEITKAHVTKYEDLEPMLKGLYHEMQELSKKKQELPLNLFKVKMINDILTEVRELLKDQPTTRFLQLLSEEELPTNSDAVLMIKQYLIAMKRFEDTYNPESGYGNRHAWQTKEERERQEAWRSEVDDEEEDEEDVGD